MIHQANDIEKVDRWRTRDGEVHNSIEDARWHIRFSQFNAEMDAFLERTRSKTHMGSPVMRDRKKFLIDNRIRLQVMFNQFFPKNADKGSAGKAGDPSAETKQGSDS